VAAELHPGRPRETELTGNLNCRKFTSESCAGLNLSHVTSSQGHGRTQFIIRPESIAAETRDRDVLLTRRGMSAYDASGSCVP
jgi:hypothetical protein